MSITHKPKLRHIRVYWVLMWDWIFIILIFLSFFLFETCSFVFSSSCCSKSSYNCMITTTTVIITITIYHLHLCISYWMNVEMINTSMIETFSQMDDSTFHSSEHSNDKDNQPCHSFWAIVNWFIDICLYCSFVWLCHFVTTLTRKKWLQITTNLGEQQQQQGWTIESIHCCHRRTEKGDTILV